MSSIGRLLLVAVTFVATHVVNAAPASAQFFWGGGKNTVYDKKLVAFPKQYGAGQIIVSFGDRRLYHIVAKGKAVSYPIAVPREKSRWNGVLRITRKAENPTWTPTPLMRKENPKLPAFVPGGHKLNPLGVRALYLGSTMYRIHGTDAPWTIGKNVSKGCIRMHNEHVLELYPRVNIGTKVTATWKNYAPKVVANVSTPANKSSRASAAFGYRN